MSHPSAQGPPPPRPHCSLLLHFTSLDAPYYILRQGCSQLPSLCSQWVCSAVAHPTPSPLVCPLGPTSLETAHFLCVSARFWPACDAGTGLRKGYRLGLAGFSLALLAPALRLWF